MPKRQASAKQVRTWAIEQGLPVGSRGHLSADVIKQFNRSHRKLVFFSKNPMSVNKGSKPTVDPSTTEGLGEARPE